MLTCCRYIGRLLIKRSPQQELRWEILPLRGASPKASRIESGFELCRDFPGDLGPPFLHRLEARALAAMGLGLAVEFVLRLVEVDLEPAGLRDIPRRVAEHLDAVAFGIVEINRPGIAVADRTDSLAAGRANLAKGAL